MNCMDSYQLWIEKTAGEAELAEELTAINGDRPLLKIVSIKNLNSAPVVCAAYWGQVRT